jgi:type I restriction enzyme S subunit
MNHWPLKSIGDVCEVNPRLPRGHGISDDQTVSFVPMAAVDELSGTIVGSQDRPFSEVRKGYTHFKNGDVLFAKITPCMENGKAAIASNLACGIGFGSTEFHVLRSKGEVLPSWLFYFIRQPGFRKEAKRNFTGTAGQQRVPTSFLSSTLIPVPPLAEQRRIVDLLSRAEGIVRLRREAEKKALDLIPALFSDQFGTGLDSKAEVQRLADICDKITDGAHKTPTYVDSGIPFLRVCDIQDMDINWEKSKRIPIEEHRILTKRCKPERGDILYSKNGTIGIAKEVTWKDEFSTFVSLALIKPKRGVVHPTFLTTFLNTPFALKQAKDRTKVGTVQNLHLEEIREIKVPLPSIDLQIEFVEQAAKVQSIQIQQSNATAKARATFDALLGRVFTLAL